MKYILFPLEFNLLQVDQEIIFKSYRYQIDSKARVKIKIKNVDIQLMN